jgi:hypothetical protein
MEALQQKHSDMEECHNAAESERKFNARMSKLEADYDMDTESRTHIAKDIHNMSDEEYGSYEMKLSALMKEKSKTYKNQLSEKLKASLKEEDAAKASKKKKEDEEEDEKKKKEEDEKKKETEAKLALASARSNIVDSSFDNHIL